MSVAQLDVLVHGRDAACVVVGDVMVSVFRTSAPTRLHQIALASARHFARHPTGIASLVVLDRAADLAMAPHSDAERKEFGAGLTRAASYIRATAVVVEQTGFVAASIRVFVSGIALVARLPYPLKAFETLDDGVRWLVPRVTAPAQHDAQIQAVTAAVGQVRALLGGRPA